jgi:hypothetical protein
MKTEELQPEIVDALDHLLDQYDVDNLRKLAKDLTAVMEKPKIYVPYPKQEMIHRSKAKIVLVTGGNRCLRGDQRIVTARGLVPVAKIRAGDLVLGYDLGSKKHRWSLSSGAFAKGWSRQYRVVHEAGEFVCDGRHQIALPEGKYEFVENLSCGQEMLFASPALRPTTEDVSTSRLFSDAVNLTRRLASSAGDYLGGNRLCDQQLRPYQAFSREWLRRCNGVVAFCGLVCREVVGHARTILARRFQHSRLGQCKNLLRKIYSRSLALGQCETASANPYASESSPHTSEDIRPTKQSLEKTAQGQTAQQSDLATSCNFSDHSYDSSCTISKIKSIEQLDTSEKYWDIQVAHVDNYFTEDGILHHNSGKSELGAREIVWRMLGTHPFKKTRVPIKIWVGANSFKQLSKVIWPKIKSYLEPRHIVKIKKNNEGYVEHVSLINGATLDMKTYKQDVMDWESEDIDVLWCDEPPPREHFMAAQRGLVDRGGDTLITATPLREPWMHEEIVLKSGKAGYSVEAFSLSSYDNPHTDHEALRRFESGLTPEERRTRIYGEFKKLIGRVLNHFSEDGPMILPAFKIPDEWPRYEGLDPHMSKPHGVIMLAVTPKRNAVIYHAERPVGGMRDLAIHLREHRHGIEPMIPPIVDTSVQQFDNSIGMTQREQLMAEGIEVILANKKDQVLPGLERMNRMFWNAQQDQPEGLYVMDNCTMFIDEAKRLTWNAKKVDTPRGSDDLIDPARYVIQHDPINMSQAIKVTKPKYNASYTSTFSVDGFSQVNSVDSRKYSNKRFDLDLDDEEEKPKYKVRY